jgi:hypothetical protein
MDTDTTPVDAPGGPNQDAAGAPEPEEIAIGHDWARRRLDLYAGVERALREGIANALQTAAQIRADVERDAETYLRRLAADRARLTDELADLESQRQAAESALARRRQEIESDLEARRQAGEAEIERRSRAAEEELARLRGETEAEVTRLRGEAEEEVARLRSTARDEIDQMAREAEARRAQVAAEVRALEEQVAQIQGVIDNFLDSQLQTLRGSLGGSARPRSGAPAAPAPAPRGPSPAEGGPAEGPHLDLTGWPVREGVGTSPAGAAPAPDADFAATTGTPEAPAGEPSPAGTPPPEGTERTSVVITGVPHFSRARALWQAIQAVPGVTEAKAINYQGGVLALEVQHDPSLDLPGSVADLPGLRLRVAEAAPGELRLAVEA